MADRDWTEFCHWCKEPLALYEEVRDVGQDLNDKATTVTRRVGDRAGLKTFLMAWRTDRPDAAQAEIDALNRRLRELERAYPITGFTARQLHPRPSRLIDLDPEEWWAHVYLLHRAHHAVCSRAHGREIAVHEPRMRDAQRASELWTPDSQLLLEAVA